MKQIRETSDFVCKKLISKVTIDDDIRILEPSCGDGKILKYIVDNYDVKNIWTVGVELNKERISKANNDLVANIPNNFNRFDFYQADFLSWEEYIDPLNSTDGKFDVIIACPPFKNNVDLEHIRRMYDLLDVTGEMVTLTSPYWITNNEVHQVDFRRWLEDKNYSLEILPDNSFMEKGKSVPTAILTIKKY